MSSTVVPAYSIPEGAIEEDGVIRRPDGLRYLTPGRAAAFLGLVRAGEALMRVLDAELEAEHRISIREFEVLLMLAVFAPDGEMRMSQLSERAPLSQSRVSRLVADLEARGLVERSPVAEDGRGVTVSITPQGVSVFKAAQNTQLAGLESRLFSQLTTAETRQLATITAKIVGACH